MYFLVNTHHTISAKKWSWNNWASGDHQRHQSETEHHVLIRKIWVRLSPKWIDCFQTNCKILGSSAQKNQQSRRKTFEFLHNHSVIIFQKWCRQTYSILCIVLCKLKSHYAPSRLTLEHNSNPCKGICVWYDWNEFGNKPFIIVAIQSHHPQLTGCQTSVELSAILWHWDTGEPQRRMALARWRSFW